MDRDSVQRILTDAKEVVDAAGVGSDLKPIAFEKAVDLLAGTTPRGQGVQNGSGGRGAGRDGDGGGGGGTGAVVGDKVGTVAKKMHVDADKVARVFDFEENDVAVTIKRSALPKDRAGATQELALLYAAARQAGEYDDTHTKGSAIRQLASDVGVLDANNFAAHLTRKRDWFTIKGSGANREFKVTNTGYEEAGKIVLKLTGGQS